MKFVGHGGLRSWLQESGSLFTLSRSIGAKHLDSSYLEQVLGLPLHLRFVIDRLADERGMDLADDALNSIPFYSLCRGLFLPLAGMSPEKVAYLFGFLTEAPPNAAERELLLETFLAKSIGLNAVQKIACVLGDPFMGKPSTMGRDSLIRLLMSTTMVGRREFLDRLTVVGDVAVLFAESRNTLRAELQLTASEVLETLRLLPDERRGFKFDLLRSLLLRCGKLEAYFLAKLLLRKAGFGFEYQGPLLARTLADHFGVDADHVAHAMALTDAFEVTRRLASKGTDGLRSIRLQPLVPVRPALAGGTTDQIKSYPVWVERKYDGIRLMLHKSSDQRGSTLCGAYTRNRGDWLELATGLTPTISSLPAQTAIVDGELYGTVLTPEGARPASVYDVYVHLQGDRSKPLNLKYAAFDLLYLNGADITGLPLSERRQRLQYLVAPLQHMPLPLPIALSDGQMARDSADLNRLYQHFRAQGYEGVLTKDLAGAYKLAGRDPMWMKRKPAITLDLVLIGAVFAVTEKTNHALFGSYVIAARNEQGAFEDIGDIAGLDRQRDAQIQAEVAREGLITGRRIERTSASGTRPGLELRPQIVVTVKFEGVVKDNITKRISLRSPQLVVIRSDKSPFEADSTRMLEELYLKQRVG